MRDGPAAGRLRAEAAGAPRRQCNLTRAWRELVRNASMTVTPGSRWSATATRWSLRRRCIRGISESSPCDERPRPRLRRGRRRHVRRALPRALPLRGGLLRGRRRSRGCQDLPLPDLPDVARCAHAMGCDLPQAPCPNDPRDRASPLDVDDGLPKWSGHKNASEKIGV